MRAVGLGLAVCLAACTAARWPDPQTPDNRPADLQRVDWSRPEQKEALTTAGLLGVTPGGETIRISTGAGGPQWRTPTPGAWDLIGLGGLVIVLDDAQVTVLNAADGSVRHREPHRGLRFMGAARSGQTLLLVWSTPDAPQAPRTSRLMALSTLDWRARWQRSMRAVAGAPQGLSGGFVVPWDRQNLSVVGADTGREVARLRAQADVFDWLEMTSGGLRFGGKQRFRVEKGQLVGEAQRAWPALPGRPRPRPSAYARRATGRERPPIMALREPTDGRGTAGGYYVYYRYVFRLDATGAVRWARVLPRRVRTARVGPAGLWVADEAGAVHRLRASDGTVAEDRAPAEPLLAARLVGSLPRLDPGDPDHPPPDLRAQLLQVALDPDAQLSPARAYAVQQLAGLPDAQVATDLLALFELRSTPALVRDALGSALSARPGGRRALLDALSRRFDFLEGTEAPPLGLLLPAIVQAELEEATQLLLAHLQDPATPVAQLHALVVAASALQPESTVTPLLQFVRLYRADSSFDSRPAPLVAAAQVIFEHGDDKARDQLRELARSSATRPALRTAIEGLQRRRQEPAVVADAVPATATAVPSSERSAELTSDALAHALGARAEQVRGCLSQATEERPNLTRVRLLVRLRKDGALQRVQVRPDPGTLQDCLTAVLRDVRWAASSTPARTVTLGLRLDPVQLPAQASPLPWWEAVSGRARRSARYRAARAQPWWHTEP